MRIVVDAMGSDTYPQPDVEGSVLAAREYNVEVILVGDEARVRPLLPAGSPLRVVHAPDMLTMQDKGLASRPSARTHRTRWRSASTW